MTLINHARTLLLGLDGPAPVYADGEEFVPPDFRAPTPTAAVAAARAAIFGGAPDRRMLVYRTRQLMAAIHATPLADAVFALDPRVTYLPLPTGGVELPAYVEVLSLDGGTPPLVAGDIPPERGGKTTRSWTLRVSAGGGMLSIVTLDGGVGTSAIVPLVYDAGLSAPIDLSSTGLTVRFPAAADNHAYVVTSRARPTAGLPEVAARLGDAGASALAVLFGGGAAEPYATWGNVWAGRRPLPERLAAVSLALIYRSEEARLAALKGN